MTDNLIQKAIHVLKLNILDCEISNAPICYSSAMIVMHVKFLMQSDKSKSTNLFSLMVSRGSTDKCITIAEFSQHPSHHQMQKLDLSLCLQFRYCDLRYQFKYFSILLN